MVCYIYEQFVGSISDRVYVDLSLNSVVTESVALDDN